MSIKWEKGARVCALLECFISIEWYKNTVFKKILTFKKKKKNI